MSEAVDNVARMTSNGLTTMSSPVDVRSHLPLIAETAVETVRLHPRPGMPDARSSSLGGPLLWPADEAWPTCDSPSCMLEDSHAPRTIPTGTSPLVPILQIFGRDVPQLPFPDGCDILQLLWCPFIHEDLAPKPLVVWRREADLEHARSAHPRPHPEAPAESLPAPCTVTPETVIEYTGEGLDRDRFAILAAGADALKARTGWDLWSDLLEAPGTKLGGHPSWAQDPDWPACACGDRMTHLATIASWEYDGVFSRRWIPLEEQPLFDLDVPQREMFAQHPEIRHPHGIMLGDIGNYHLFVCTTCPDRPITHTWACS